MLDILRSVFGIIAVLILFAPTLVLIVAAIRMSRSGKGAPAILISIGALLLTLSSLDFLYTFISALVFSPAELASFAVYMTAILKTTNYFGLLLIGLGILSLSRRLRSKG